MIKKLTPVLLLTFAQLGLFAQSAMENYVATYSARIEGLSALSSITDTAEVIASIQYYDGLGRPTQNVLRKGSPTAKDIISVTGYDGYGRQHKNYLPYEATNASNNASGNYRSDWSTEISSFYNGSGAQGVPIEGSYYYNETQFEESPLNRPIASFGAGSKWRTDNKAATYDYEINTLEDTVPRFSIGYTDLQLISFEGNYADGTLSITTTTDENGNTTEEFKDLMGRVVCKRSEVTSGVEASTLYLYDDFGSLTFVIPPEGVAHAQASWEDSVNYPSFRGKWLFRYKYDGRRRMVEKQVPGSATVYMVYDKRDRLVLTQDGNQRGANFETIDANTPSSESTLTSPTNQNYLITSGILTLSPGFSAGAGFIATTDPSTLPNEWMFTKYDELNRPIMTGIATLSGDRQTVQGLVNAHPESAYTESYSGSGSYHGYTNVAYPVLTTSDEVLTVSYYDNYDFTTTASTNPEAITWAKGLATGSKVKVLGTTTYLETVTWYDDRLRPIEVLSDNYLGGSDRQELTYFNKIRPSMSNTKQTHIALGETTTIEESYTYDHMERPIKTFHEINGLTRVTLHKNSYNALGVLHRKELGRLGAGSYIQSVDYAYNIRGWLTKVNNGTGFSGTDKFGMELQYANAGQYNGNIGKMLWRTAQGSASQAANQSYDFTYDRLSRLKKADYNEGISYDNHFDVGGSDNGQIDYDLNGNIKSLTRKYGDNLSDSLTYQYTSGNQLSAVQDTESDAGQGFEETYSEGLNPNEYRYDANGNMIADDNKGITGIAYNHLNLPQSVSTPNGAVSYVYDATGTKLRKTDAAGKVSDYIGGIHYEKDVGNSTSELKFILHAEGRAVKSGSNFDYQYNLTDHLGNVRVTLDQSGTVIQRDDYYPFGLTFNHWDAGDKNNYLFNGVEQDQATGNYETLFRGYDPALGRFMQIDPLADFISGITPYNFAFNNPISMNDPEGLIGRKERRRRRTQRKNARTARQGRRKIAQNDWSLSTSSGSSGATKKPDSNGTLGSIRKPEGSQPGNDLSKYLNKPELITIEDKESLRKKDIPIVEENYVAGQRLAVNGIFIGVDLKDSKKSRAGLYRTAKSLLEDKNLRVIIQVGTNYTWSNAPSRDTRVSGTNLNYGQMIDARTKAIMDILINEFNAPKNQIKTNSEPAYGEGNTNFILDFK